MRWLLLAVFCVFLKSGWAQTDPLDEVYTPPTNAKFRTAGGKSNSSTFFSGASQAPYLWAVKFHPVFLMKNHAVASFEMSVTENFGIEPQIGLLFNKSDMYTDSYIIPDFNSFEDGIIGDFINRPASALSYKSVWLNANPRSLVIPSLGINFNLYNAAARSSGSSTWGLFIQLGYRFSGMRYELDGLPLANEESRTGMLSRHILRLMWGYQLRFGDRYPLIIDYGIEAAFNFLRAPTFTNINQGSISNGPLYEKQGYANTLQPIIGPRISIGLGPNP
jgi:hypothetical protein